MSDGKIDLTKFTCDICGKPATEKGLVVQVKFQDFEDYEKAMEPYEETGVTLGDELPEHPSWQIVHPTCGDEPSYYFEFARCDTPAKAVEWTIQLSEKTWFAGEYGGTIAAAWGDFLHRLFGRIHI